MNGNVPLSSVSPGEVVAFEYNGGSNPGGLRVVRVTKTDDNHVWGDDLNAQPDANGNIFRDFLKHKVDNGQVHLVASANEEIVQPSTLVGSGVKVTGPIATALYQLNNPDKKHVRYDSCAGLIVAARDDLPRIELEITADKISFNVVNEEGKGFGIQWDHAGLAPTKEVIHCRMNADTLEKFADGLSRHVAVAKASPSPSTSSILPTWSDYVVSQARAGHPFYSKAGAQADG